LSSGATVLRLNPSTLGLLALLAMACGCAVFKGLGPTFVSLPPIPQDSVISLEPSRVPGRTLDQEGSRKVIAEVNKLRIKPWRSLDGKVSNPSLMFTVNHPGSEPIWFSLSGDAITQHRGGPSLHAGGFYVLGLQSQEVQRLTALFNTSQ
jgi:hypothetical protein